MPPPDLIISESKRIGGSEPCFVIAEIGQNHQGDLSLAKELIAAAKECGADCVKFQKSCLEEKFVQRALDSEYRSEHAWGRTYGEHKSHLEFSQAEYEELRHYSTSLGLLFTASAMDPVSLNFLDRMDVPFIKIGSGDADNWILLQKAAETEKPLVISTGMQDLEGVERTYKLVSRTHKKFALLHCVSAYPQPPAQSHLRVLNKYIREFPDIHIGYSGHEIGYNITLAAVAMGAKVVERHITMDKSWKGNDHRCSLEPGEFRAMVEAIREVEAALGEDVKEVQESERECLRKLGKSGVAGRRLEAGTVLAEGDLKIKVAGEGGIRPHNLLPFIGKRLKVTLEPDDIFLLDHFDLS